MNREGYFIGFFPPGDIQKIHRRWVESNQTLLISQGWEPYEDTIVEWMPKSIIPKMGRSKDLKKITTHATVIYVGGIDEEMGDLSRGLRNLSGHWRCSDKRPLHFETDGITYLPGGQNPAYLALVLQEIYERDGESYLAEIRADIDSLRKSVCVDTKKAISRYYEPHLTLARAGELLNAKKDAPIFQLPFSQSFEINWLYLVRSTTTHSKHKYTVLEAFAI